jgi:hypothetical protein
VKVSSSRVAPEFDLDETAVEMILHSLESSIEDWSKGDSTDELEPLRDLRVAFFAALIDCKDNRTR